MNILKTLAVLVLSGVATLPGVALAEVIDCTMDPGFNRWFIAPVIRVEIGKDGSVKVSDDLIRSTDRKSVFGEVAKDTEKLVSVTWELAGIEPDPAGKFGQQGYPRLLMRLSVKRSDGGANLTVTDVNLRGQSFRAAGTCSFRK